ncbi:polysaccharide deacetylase family protein [Granulosicoccus antarcticus]
MTESKKHDSDQCPNRIPPSQNQSSQSHKTFASTHVLGEHENLRQNDISTAQSGQRAARRLEIVQTFFIPGWVMERYPKTVDAILEGGHEIGHHSWAHEDPMEHSDEKEAELFGRALDTHVRMTGRRPCGYRAPVYSLTPAIVNRLIEHDFLYDSSMMADDLPYEVVTSKGSIIEIPPHWGTDDWWTKE